jgi:tRNA nucleotidyltransferase (CCA-adding enzyme)
MIASIKDIMSQPVVSVSPTTTLAETVKLLTKHHFSGAPVVCSEGAVLGIISDLALLDILFDFALKDAPVAQFMDREVQAVAPSDSLVSAAYMFALYGIRRLPVIEHGTIVGIVTRRDLMNHAVTGGEPITEPLVELIPSLGLLT